MDSLFLHHLGVATRSIEKEFPFYEALGYKRESPVFADETQGINGLFITAKGQPRLELLENAGTEGPLDSYINRGIKIYHFAYSVQDIDTEVERIITKTRAKLITPVQKASYFTKICFLMFPNMMMVELVQPRGE